jgi:predicted ferric reductase
MKMTMKIFYTGTVLAAMLIFTAGALSIPFVYESTTLWYKMGFDKTMLRSGQVAGMLALSLLLIQILLAARGRFLVENFGLAAIVRWHRINGLLIGLAGVVHVTLVLAPEGFANLPIGVKHWPEMVGGGLFITLLFMVFSSHFRERLHLNYEIWFSIHRVLGYLVPVILAVHVLFVSDSFQQFVPRTALLMTICIAGGLVLLSKKTGS